MHRDQSLFQNGHERQQNIFKHREKRAVENRPSFLRQGMALVRQVTIGPMLVGRKPEKIGWESVPMPPITAHPDWLENLQKWANQKAGAFSVSFTSECGDVAIVGNGEFRASSGKANGFILYADTLQHENRAKLSREQENLKCLYQCLYQCFVLNHEDLTDWDI